jgi:hypothetical protein
VQRDEVHRDPNALLLQLFDALVARAGKLLLNDADDEKVPGVALRPGRGCEEIQPAEGQEIPAGDFFPSQISP